MATRDGLLGKWTLGKGLTRPALAYLLIIVVGTWLFIAVEDLRTGGDPVGAPVAAARGLLGFGLGGLAFIALLLLPAFVVTLELVQRLEAPSRAARSVLGAAAWAGWCLFIAVTLVVASRVVMVPDSLAGALFVFGMSGAGFSLLAFDGRETRAGKSLTLLAMAVTWFVILGSIWMAGRWSGAA